MNVLRFKNGQMDGVALAGVAAPMARTVAAMLNRANQKSDLQFVPDEEGRDVAGGHSAAGGDRV